MGYFGDSWEAFVGLTPIGTVVAFCASGVVLVVVIGVITQLWRLAFG